MRRILVQLYLPASEKVIDMRIPQQISVAQATKVITSMVKRIEDNTYVPAPDAVLCDASTGKIYDAGASIESLKFYPGKKIMLI